jgi:hypothetical protein
MQNRLVGMKPHTVTRRQSYKNARRMVYITGNNITAGKVLLMYIKTFIFLFHAAQEIDDTFSYCDFFYILLPLWTVDTVVFWILNLGVILYVKMLPLKTVALKMAWATGQTKAKNRYNCFVMLLRTAYNDTLEFIGMWGITRLTLKHTAPVIACIIFAGEQPKFWRVNFTASWYVWWI